jgi:hypothetical protein
VTNHVARTKMWLYSQEEILIRTSSVCGDGSRSILFHEKDGMWTASLGMVNTGERVVGSNRPALSIRIGG